MRRIWIAAAAFLLVAGLCIGSLYSLKLAHKELIIHIDTALSAYEMSDYVQYQENIDRLSACIDTHTTWMTGLFYQDFVDEIEESSEMATAYAKNAQWTDAYAQMKRCQHAVEELYAIECPMWNSIF